MMTAPCKDCPDRKTGCHSTCHKYIEFDNRNRERREKRLRSFEVVSVTRESIHRAIKEKHVRH